MRRRNQGRLPRCVRCRLQTHHCVCANLKKIQTETQVVVVAHPKEADKPTNTGHLVRYLLSDSQFIKGSKDLSDLGLDKGRRVFALFPSEDAQELTSSLRDISNTPITLVVPDGSWRQARRMVRHWPIFSDYPAVTLPLGHRTMFFLRKYKTQLSQTSLSTLEAVGRAMGILESQYVEDGLLAQHDLVVRRGLLARGLGKAYNISESC